MGQLLIERLVSPDIILCSTAMRAQETAALLFGATEKPQLILDRTDLYHASPDEIIQILNELDDSVTSAMVIGHNPGLEELLSQLTGQTVHFPTAAMAVLALDVETWGLVNRQIPVRLDQIFRPKELGNNKAE